MINFYSGVPGSGKTYHAVKDAQFYAKAKRHVIVTFPCKSVRKRYEKYFHYCPLNEITPEYLVAMAETHGTGKENSIILIIDEAQRIFNTREYSKEGRKEWLDFFSLHRHYGYLIIMIAQHDKMLDKQIRCLFESEFKHRSVKNYKMFGFVLSLIFHGSFVSLEYWYGGNKLSLSKRVFVGHRHIYKCYNTFDKDYIKKAEKERTVLIAEARAEAEAECSVSLDEVGGEGVPLPNPKKERRPSAKSILSH